MSTLRFAAGVSVVALVGASLMAGHAANADDIKPPLDVPVRADSGAGSSNVESTVAPSRPLYFTAELDGTSEVPPNLETGSGFARVTLNALEDSINVSVIWTGLSGSATAGHIHGPASAGATAPVLFNLNPAAATAGQVSNAVYAVTSGQVQDLKNGLMYVNLHTVVHPGGELRGQLHLDSPYPAYLNGIQENPASNEAGSGSAMVSLSADGSTAFVSLSVEGLSGNATGAHLHAARSGINGPIQCDLGSLPLGTSTGVSDAVCALTGIQALALRKAQMYVNVHTAAHPGGELRGQVQRRRSTVFDFDGDSATDLVIARSVGGSIEWWIKLSGGGETGTVNGSSADLAQDRILACDYDGDGLDDPMVWHSATSPGAGFLIVPSSTGEQIFEQFGTTGDDPRVIGDYDGDGRCDLAVFRNNDDAWYYRPSAKNPNNDVFLVQWGTSFANPGDFDGDGRFDFTDQQSDQLWTRFADGTYRQTRFASANIFVSPGDYDGDGRTDIAGSQIEGSNTVWYIQSSATTSDSVVGNNWGADVYGARISRAVWGIGTPRIRCQGDFDGDGHTDAGIYQKVFGGAGEFWVRYQDDTYNMKRYGDGPASGDIALCGSNNR